MVLKAEVSSFGAIVQPQRQPVIAYDFDAEPARTVRSRCRSNSTFTRLCGTCLVDQLLVAEVDDDPDAALRRRVGDRRQRRLVDQAAGRVARRVDDDRLRLRRDRRDRSPRRARANPSSARVGTITGIAPTSLTCSGIVGQYGACVMTSSPVIEQRQRGVEERLLAAGGQQHFGRRDVDAVLSPCSARRSPRAAPECRPPRCSG